MTTRFRHACQLPSVIKRMTCKHQVIRSQSLPQPSHCSVVLGDEGLDVIYLNIIHYIIYIYIYTGIILYTGFLLPSEFFKDHFAGMCSTYRHCPHIIDQGVLCSNCRSISLAISVLCCPWRYSQMPCFHSSTRTRRSYSCIEPFRGIVTHRIYAILLVT